MSLGKSKFMKDLQINEALQKQCDKADALEEKLAERLSKKDAAANKEIKDLISKYGA